MTRLPPEMGGRMYPVTVVTVACCRTVRYKPTGTRFLITEGLDANTTAYYGHASAHCRKWNTLAHYTDVVQSNQTGP